jgi:tetratricopeptide (TPR) repeat protein
MPKAQVFSCPSSGQLIGYIVKAFRLDDPEIGGSVSRELNATLQKTAQRFFRGERIDHETSEMLCRQFAKALFHSRLFGDFDGTVELENGPIGWDVVFERATIHCARVWDHEFWQSAAAYPRADKRLATLIVARQIAIELALRHASLVLMRQFESPQQEEPWWTDERGFGAFLKEMKDACATPLSGSVIAKELRVDDRTVDRWFGGEEIPSLVHVDALARLFAARNKDSNESMLIRTFRRAVGVASLLDQFRQIVGQRSIRDYSRCYLQFVRWTLELVASDAATDPHARSLFAAILVFGTAHPFNDPVLLDWAKKVRGIPWMDDILKSHPADRSDRLKESFRIVGEAQKRQDDLNEVMPNAPQEVREGLSELAAWLALASPVIPPEQLEKLQTGEHVMYRIKARNPAHAAENRMMQASRAAASKDFDTACLHAARAVHLQPERADYRFFFGCYLWQARRWPEAVEQLQEACRLKPDWDRPFVEIAIVHANRGLSDSAIYHLESASEDMRGGSAWLQFVLGKLHWQGKAFEKALPCFEAAMKLDDKGGEAFDLAADSAFRLGKRSLGEKYAKEAKHRGVFASFKQWQDGGHLNI